MDLDIQRKIEVMDNLALISSAKSFWKASYGTIFLML